MFIDTHCHLNSEEWVHQVELALQKAHESSVDRVFVVGWDLPSSQKAVSLAEQYEEIYAIVGVHPCDVEGVHLDDLKPLLSHPKVIALGEIGLDYHWVKEEEKQQIQKDYFIQQILLANETKKPVVIHSRDAIQETYDILHEYRPQYGCLLHCFSGSPEMMERFLEDGCMISFGGPVTFKNAKASKACAFSVPLDRFVLETDTPYLTPHPYRGQLNEPSYIPLIAQEIANIKNMKVEEVAEITTENALRFFKL